MQWRETWFACRLPAARSLVTCFPVGLDGSEDPVQS
jgi:hypothetical protein